jgi:two-component system sensor histidine kinase TctE
MRLRSLTARLLLALVVPLIVSALIVGVGGAWVTQRVVDYSSDRLLAGSVRAIAESITVENDKVWVDLPPWSLGLLDSPQRDSVYYNVRQGGRVLTGYRDLPDFDRAAIASRKPTFRTVRYKGVMVRQAAEARHVPGVAAPVIVSVAQTLDSRLAARNTLLASLGLVEAVLVALVALLIWPAARWGLRPLDALRRELAQRSVSTDLDFTPLRLDHVPGELTPVVGAFNGLLAQLDQAVEGMRRFTADASHQIRTPLAVMKVHLGVMGRRRDRGQDDQDSLADVLDGVNRLQRLLEQLLALARADVADQSALEHTDLALTVRRDLARLEAGLDRKTISYRGPAQDVWVAMSATLIEQILENLVDNAVRYGGERIVVTVSAEADLAVVEVADDGPTVSPEAAERLFERFHRAPDAAAAGSGLGLSIVRALAERSGGAAVIAVPDASDGFTVRVTLPRAE